MLMCGSVAESMHVLVLTHVYTVQQPQLPCCLAWPGSMHAVCVSSV